MMSFLIFWSPFSLYTVCQVPVLNLENNMLLQFKARSTLNQTFYSDSSNAILIPCYPQYIYVLSHQWSIYSQLEQKPFEMVLFFHKCPFYNVICCNCFSRLCYHLDLLVYAMLSIIACHIYCWGTKLTVSFVGSRKAIGFY